MSVSSMASSVLVAAEVHAALPSRPVPSFVRDMALIRTIAERNTRVESSCFLPVAYHSKSTRIASIGKAMRAVNLILS
jgi:hypothetical protein